MAVFVSALALVGLSDAPAAGTTFQLPVIFVMSSAGGTAHQLSLSGPDVNPAWSPDGTKIAYSRGSEIWVMNTDGGDPHPLGAGLEPAWSPDGTKIAVASGSTSGEIVVMHADGTNRTNLTNRPGVNTDPTWSPDGKEIAFSSGAYLGNYDIYVIGADGNNERRVTDDPAPEVSPAWSPDGAKIAFARTGTDGFGRETADLYIMNPDGTDQSRLTNDLQHDDDPAWSPNGRRIAFGRNPPDQSTREIFAVNPDGTGLVDLSHKPAWFYDGDPTWSPDGTRIAFERHQFLEAPPPRAPPPPAASCRVPRVVGQRLARARARIRRAGCSVGRVRYARSQRRGRVIAQSPRPGAMGRRGGAVNLLVGRRG